MYPERSSGFIVGLVLIVIGFLLVLLLIGYFTPQHPFGVLPNYRETLDLSCGVTVLSPKNDDLVSFPYTVSGYANGCGWGNHEGVAGRLDILHQNGIVLGTILLPVSGATTTEPYYFEQTFNMVLPKDTKNGMFVFHPAGGAFGAAVKSVPIFFVP